MRYLALDGRIIDLSTLTDQERSFFDRCFTAYRNGMPWVQFARLIEGTENPLIQATGGLITREVWNHPLFKAVNDLEHRIAIQQGKMTPGPGSDPSHDPITDVPAPTAASTE